MKWSEVRPQFNNNLESKWQAIGGCLIDDRQEVNAFGGTVLDVIERRYDCLSKRPNEYFLSLVVVDVNRFSKSIPNEKLQTEQQATFS